MTMNTTVANIISSAVTPSPAPTTPLPHLTEPFRITLIVIYTFVLLVGITGLTLMISLLKSNIRSLTTIAFLNLIFAHFLFLLTVPFRIYYYATQAWHLHMGMCKLVSAMVHIHIYMVFSIYAIILTLRFLHYYKKMQWTEFYRRLHALGASALVWLLLLLIMLPLVLLQYGESSGNHKDAGENQCFKFGKMINEGPVYTLNMIMSIFIISVSCVQTGIQAIILHAMIRKYGSASRSQQEFWVQIKNLIFVLIMLTCLVPYHLFRLHYLNHTEDLHEINEVFLAITGLTCFDMLTFTGKGVCQVCLT
ncbi:probable G-protein coupled receptor 141 [Ctenopharyngodon idella]|uniref:probable G-protein coupled receptor 141 n=1 Tax=Ctenopharyngodon idella TaxID=7959 RepID=UPI00222E8F26|nr:probable G-protein coupled receptor 141 [Ctenopharyngodon idella]XP_051738968.1 probable G-protein coupled receptor 141 [Ctenopharyngodon idella]